MNCREEYQRWLKFADDEMKVLLKSYSEKEIEDSFYRNLSFGTGGLRGVIGAGTNRMNIYTVGKASQGVADYLINKYEAPSVVIGYDSRIKSDVFAQVASDVFASNGIKVHLWKELNPVPTVSFAVRYFHASAGVMITASHNPSKYNGYKVYGDDGCQITTEVAAKILSEIEKLDIFVDVKHGKKDDNIEFIKEEVLKAYIEEVKKQSVLFGDEIDKNVSIVYSPLNGTGYVPVTRVLSEMGFTNIELVEEQRLPDGNFPTCPYPNPEIAEAMELGLCYAREKSADIFIATDPDCDRVGIAVKNKDGGFQLLSGNEVGLLLLDYICSQRDKHNMMPSDPVMIKTIVTSDLGKQIAQYYGVQTIDVLTGFKFIGEQIGHLEEDGRKNSFIFGFEESYGYLTGAYVRDKDGVNGAYMICEMHCFYKTRGISLIEKLEEIYMKYGYCLNTLHSFEFDGSAGFIKMQEIMKKFHRGLEMIGTRKVVETLDYTQGLNGLPKSDVIKYILENNCSVVVRPSGTEPKLKMYISINAENKQEVAEEEQQIIDYLKKYFE